MARIDPLGNQAIAAHGMLSTQLEDERERAAQQLSAEQKRSTVLQQKVDELTHQRLQLSSRIDSNSHELNEAVDAALAAAHRDSIISYDQLQQENTTLTDNIQQLQHQLAGAVSDAVVQRQVVTDLESTLTRQQQRLMAVDAELGTLSRSNAELDSTVHELRSRLDDVATIEAEYAECLAVGLECDTALAALIGTVTADGDTAVTADATARDAQGSVLENGTLDETRLSAFATPESSRFVSSWSMRHQRLLIISAAINQHRSWLVTLIRQLNAINHYDRSTKVTVVDRFVVVSNEDSSETDGRHDAAHLFVSEHKTVEWLKTSVDLELKRISRELDESCAEFRALSEMRSNRLCELEEQVQ